MNLENQIMEQLKIAMKNKDQIALTSLRALKSAILLEKTSGNTTGEITETDELKIIQKQIKMRKDAAEQFSQNGATEMAEKELEEVKIIEQFLPAQLSLEEIETAIKQIIKKTNAQSIKDLGKVMNTATESLMGKTDGKTISTIAKQLLTQ